MSMTREEALEELERLLRHWDDLENDKRCFWGYDKEAVALALSALRPISREQVEKVCKGEWIVQQDEHKEYIKKCSKCGFPISGWWGADKFCANCGTPMTDEPLTIEQLREMEGEPVWVELYQAWALVEVKQNGSIMFYGNSFSCSYSRTWQVYRFRPGRHPPEGEA